MDLTVVMMQPNTKIENLIPIWQLPHPEDPIQPPPLIQDTPLDEKEFARYEWHKGINLFQTNVEQGVQTIYRMLEMANRHRFQPSIAMARLALGYYEGQRGHIRPSRRHLFNALAEVRLDNLAFHEGTTYYYLGWVCCLENAHCEAITYLQQSLFLAYHSQSLLLEASSHFQMGYVYAWERKWKQAFDHTDKSLNLFLALNHPQGILETYHQQITILEEAHQLEEAERILKLALVHAQQYGTFEQQIRLLQKYSFLKYKQGSLSESTQALGVLMMQPNLADDFTLENYELARKLQAALGKKQFEKLALFYANLPLIAFVQTLFGG
ncbi:MAG: hypothetical protein ACOYLB_08705 [Phototrophicaceae bacterium]